LIDIYNNLKNILTDYIKYDNLKYKNIHVYTSNSLYIAHVIVNISDTLVTLFFKNIIQ